MTSERLGELRPLVQRFTLGEICCRKIDSSTPSRRPSSMLAESWCFSTSAMALAGYRLEDIVIVVFTHLQPDHIGGVREGDALAYPNARYVIGRAEFDSWIDGYGIPPSRTQNRDQVQKQILPLAALSTFIEPG